MDYSPLNPIIWGVFLGFAVFVWAAVRLFAARHPDYPGEIPPPEN